MAWTVIFIQDTSATGVGTLRATFHSVDGSVTTSHSQRVDTSSKDGVAAFVAACQAMNTKQEQDTSAAQALAAAIQAKLNA